MFDSGGWVWSAASRTAQTGLESAPHLLCGLFAAAAVRVLVAPADLRRFFAADGLTGLLRAWGVAALLPVDALGVLPVARQLQRAGVPPGTVLTFALAAPLLNPLSLVYGLTRLEPAVVLGLVAVPLGLTVGLGAVVNRWSPTPAGPAVPPPAAGGAAGWPRVAALVLAVAREVTGPTLAFVAAALVGAGAVGAAMPDAFYRLAQVSPRATDLPVGLAAAALPAVVGPEKGMLMAGNLLDGGGSFGVALTFLLFAAGLNLGTLAWVFGTFPGRLAARAVAAWLGLALAAGCVGHWLDPAGSVPTSEVQAKAFGDLGRIEGDSAAAAWGELAGRVTAPGVGAVGLLALLGVAGVVSRRAGDAGTPEAMLARTAEPPVGGPTVWNRSVPARYLVLLCLAGGVGAVVAVAYAYYPGPAVLFEDMKALRDEALITARSGSRAKAVEQVRAWERQARKLPVGLLLRRGGLDAAQREGTDRLLTALDRLRLALEEGTEDEVEAAVRDARAAFDRCRSELLGDGEAVR